MKRLTVILVALGLLAALTGCDAAPKTFSLETAAEQRGASFADACTALGLSAEADADPSEAVFSAPDSVTLADKTFNIGFIAAPDAAETVGGLQITRTAAQEDAEAEGALALEVYDQLVESFGEPDRRTAHRTACTLPMRTLKRSRAARSGAIHGRWTMGRRSPM